MTRDGGGGGWYSLGLPDELDGAKEGLDVDDEGGKIGDGRGRVVEILGGGAGEREGGACLFGGGGRLELDGGEIEGRGVDCEGGSVPLGILGGMGGTCRTIGSVEFFVMLGRRGIVGGAGDTDSEELLLLPRLDSPSSISMLLANGFSSKLAVALSSKRGAGAWRAGDS